MIAHLRGTLLDKSTQVVVVETGGIGYEVWIPLSTFYALPEPEHPVSLHVHTHVREDTLQLFGFHTRLEKELFLLLTAVTGIGPKLAANILSGIGPGELLDAIAGGDAPRLQAIPGVGRKTAERIALELRDRAAALAGRQEARPRRPPDRVDQELKEDALSALVNLGYAGKAARQAIDRAGASLAEVNLEALIKKALSLLA